MPGSMTLLEKIHTQTPYEYGTKAMLLYVKAPLSTLLPVLKGLKRIHSILARLEMKPTRAVRQQLAKSSLPKEIRFSATLFATAS